MQNPSKYTQVKTCNIQKNAQENWKPSFHHEIYVNFMRRKQHKQHTSSVTHVAEVPTPVLDKLSRDLTGTKGHSDLVAWSAYQLRRWKHVETAKFRNGFEEILTDVQPRCHPISSDFAWLFKTKTDVWDKHLCHMMSSMFHMFHAAWSHRSTIVVDVDGSIRGLSSHTFIWPSISLVNGIYKQQQTSLVGALEYLHVYQLWKTLKQTCAFCAFKVQLSPVCGSDCEWGRFHCDTWHQSRDSLVTRRLKPMDDPMAEANGSLEGRITWPGQEPRNWNQRNQMDQRICAVLKTS